MPKRTVTQEDLDNDPTLADQGAVLGEEFDFPEAEAKAEAEEEEGSQGAE